MKQLLSRILQIFTHRIIWLSFILIGGFLVIFTALYRIQIKDQKRYQVLAEQQKTAEPSVSIKPLQARGCIYDRCGVPLAVNEESLALYYIPSAENENLGESLYLLKKILDQHQISFSYDQAFPLTYNPREGFKFSPAFDESVNEINHLNFLAEVYGTSRDELTEEQRRTNAETAFTELYHTSFELPEGLSRQEEVVLASVRYAIFSGRFSPDDPVRLASGIPEEIMVHILEKPDLFKGFAVRKEYERIYPQKDLFAHVVGYVGRISAEELEEWTLDGEPYASDAVVGKSGIELAYEQQLAKGYDVYLTIDLRFQQQCFQALEKQITSLLVAKITDVPSEKGDTYTTADVFASMIENRIFKESMLQSGLPVMELFLSTGENAKEYYLETLEQQILNNGPIKDYPESIKAFYDLLITLMRDEERLSYQYQRDEDFYVPYAAGEKGAYDLFSHALAHQYIPLEEYKLEESMLPEDKIPVIVRDEISRMSQSSQFQTMVYQRMVKDAWFSASDMLLLLYEQGILSTEDGSRDRLVNEEESPLQILLMKIQNLELTPQQIALDPCSGSVVVTDPFSGEVLAMSSYPSFDPMRFMNDNAYYDEIVLDITSPLSFRAVYEARAIGSTYKMCTAITALELGVIDEKTKIKDGYEFPYVNSVDHPHCWTEVSHGEINVAEALDHSCNYFFYQLGYLLSEPDAKHQFDDSVGLKKMANYAKKLGLASVTGIEIGETVPRTSEIDAVRSSIGQGTNAFTTANVNRYTCTLINGGDVYSLYMVDEVKDPGGRTLYLSDAKAEYNAEVKEENLQIVRKGMRMVVTDEHKDEFAPLESIGIHAAGKTGTVQEIEDRPDHSLFTGYTTVENPEITVTIMIPFGGGSHNAIPVFIDVVTAYYGIFS